VAERLNAPVLKTGMSRGIQGSTNRQEADLGAPTARAKPEGHEWPESIPASTTFYPPLGMAKKNQPKIVVHI